MSKTVSDSAKALSELERNDASASVGFAKLEELKVTSELAAGQDDKSSAQYSDFVPEIAALEKTHAAIIAEKTKVPGNTNAGLNSIISHGSVSELDEELSKTVPKALSEHERKDAFQQAARALLSSTSFHVAS